MGINLAVVDMDGVQEACTKFLATTTHNCGNYYTVGNESI
ncbi:hypothetical protein CLV25_11443 [Acetobacteroides hydrogenigenes]|uniref:Uncharacterized protein n=1 Tax=Acetobacteroides hydrogenigenes TaxID=979970 RepID=A0A4R2E621_9BACT|nr:hypothetical protein CLV25_11443 [Acetobacteroides hydrogenigenes]